MKKFFLLVIIYLFIPATIYSQSNTTWIGWMSTPTAAFDVKIEGKLAFVVGWLDVGYGSLSIIDIQTPSAPNLISSIFINDAYGIDVKGNHAFIAESNAGLTIYDFSNPTNPTLIGQIILPGSAKDVKVIDSLTYVADEYAGLRIIDISDLTDPVEIGFFDSPGRSFDVEIKDSIAYLADATGGFFCIDISDPTNPTVINAYSAGDAVIDIDLKDSLAYYTDGYAGIKVLNISDPLNLQLIGSLYIPNWCLGINVSGDYAYVAAWSGGLRIVDISDPSNMQDVGYYSTWGLSRDVDVVDPLAYLADWSGGLQIINNNLINPIPVELVSFNADYNAGNVKLSWITATELNNSGFDIERKTEDGEWNKITFIQGNGTTTEVKHYFFSDDIKKLNASKLIYRLKQIDFDGASKYSREIEVEINLPIRFQLEQNYPNPFNPVTSIKYEVPINSLVTLKVFDLLGSEVETLVDERKDAGYYQIDFDASRLSSGIYFYTLRAENYFITKKMILMK